VKHKGSRARLLEDIWQDLLHSGRGLRTGETDSWIYGISCSCWPSSDALKEPTIRLLGDSCVLDMPKL
jgi:L-alanine-DL-glutamate epimerase-like enolase superfamily enzyme